MPPSFASLLAPQTGDGEEVPPLDALPGSSTSQKRNIPPEHVEGALIASAGPVGSSKRKRVAVVDGLQPASAPDADDFAPPPVVTSQERRRGARGRGPGSRFRRGDAPRDGADADQSGRGRGRGRGGGRRGASSARQVQLARDIEPLARHVRAIAERPVDVRRTDDVDDAVDGTDDDNSVGSDANDSDDSIDDAPNRHEDFASQFCTFSWSQVACEGLDTARAPMPDAPLDFGSPRTKAPMGAEVPHFARQEHQPGAIRSKIEAKLGRGCTSTLAFVKLLFADDILDTLVAATNKAALEHPRVKNLSRMKGYWQPIDRKSLLMWFAIATYLGVVKVQNRKHAFGKRSLFRQPWVRKHYTLQQFENVLNALNCCDHWNLSDDEFKRRNDDYCFWQVDELIKQCNVNAQAYFRLGHRISIDEACIPWKGRHRARCYNPKKPHKFHFKKLMLNDSKTGYNYNFYYYGGKGEERPDYHSATTWPIVKLLSTTTVSAHNKNHLIAVDNWFTSSSSFAWLAKHGYVAVGTVGKNKLGVVSAKRPNGFPTAGIFKKSAARARGSYVVHKGKLMHSECGARAEPFDCWVTSWQDRNPVHFLSTYKPSNAWCKRKVRLNGQRVEGQWPRPSVAHHYNQTMGGTALHDQRCATYRSVVKSRRWQVRVLTDTFGSMLQIAFILYHDYHKKNKQYTSLNFIEDLLREIGADEPDEEPEPAMRPRTFNEHRRDYWVKGPGSDIRLEGRNHWPKDARGEYPTHHPNTGAVLDLRRLCIWDPNNCGRTNTYCSCCMVPVCLAHFECFHTSAFHEFPDQPVKRKKK
jgi:hypothetical protein